MKLRIPIGLLIVFSLSVLLAPAASATTLLPKKAAEMVDESRLIVLGTAVHQEVVLSEDGQFPFTFVTFRVEESLKGSAQDGEITLRFHGGTLPDGSTVTVEGAPQFSLGETYLLFIRANGVHEFPIVGWRQGQLRMDRDPRSGKAVFVEGNGRLVAGLSGERFVLAESGADALAKEEVRASVLAMDGVQVEPADSVQPAEAAPARQVLAGLRRMVARRTALKSFTPGQPVLSARPSDVPATVRFNSALIP